MVINREKIMDGILFALQEFYAEELNRKIRSAKTANALNCRFNGGIVPYGYGINEERQYTVDPLTAPIVVEIFKQYVDGWSLRDIQQSLSSKNIASVSFSISRIRRLLKNRIYIGEYRYSNITIADGVPAIIPGQLFEQAQSMMESKAHKKEVAKNEF